jgi:hypothetical protein
MRHGVTVAAVVALLTALTYFVFPGHTYLQQDTQIYLPMLEKLEHPELFARELLTSRPHMAWTLYDETAIALRRVTGLDFESVLTIEQWLTRALGIWGVFLIGTSLGFTRRLSLFAAAVFSLGATIVGPSVLTLEYEPVPRGFAVPLVFCALGLLVHDRPGWSALAASAALLYHAPTTAPFWLVFAAVTWRKRSWKPWLPPAAALIVVFVFSRYQPGLTERQPLFSTISPALQQLQRMRAAYNWVSLWPRAAYWHYAILCGIAGLALRRLRSRLSDSHWIVFSGLLGIGAASVPVSYLTLEVLHWSLIPQFQPARAVLFITAITVILSALAAFDAAFERRYQETFAWLVVPFLIPIHPLVTPPYIVGDALMIAALAAGATAAAAVHVLSPRRATPALAMVALGAFFAIPLIGGVRNYPALWNHEILDLAEWARKSTPTGAVFHFEGAGKDLSPGLFRAKARRAVYVDWKGGGQVNYFEDLALEWWERWRHTMLRPASNEELAARGVDYLVMRLPNHRPGLEHIYSNAYYVVYQLRAN